MILPHGRLLSQTCFNALNLPNLPSLPEAAIHTTESTRLHVMRCSGVLRLTLPVGFSFDFPATSFIEDASLVDGATANWPAGRLDCNLKPLVVVNGKRPLINSKGIKIRICHHTRYEFGVVP